MTLSAYELEDLRKAVSARLDDELLPALTLANRTGELGELLRLLGMGDLMGDDGGARVVPTKVVVIGDSAVKEDKLRSIARKQGRTSSSPWATSESNTTSSPSCATRSSTAPSSSDLCRTAPPARVTPPVQLPRWNTIRISIHK